MFWSVEMSWECINCTNRVDDGIWFCCNACRIKYEQIQQNVVVQEHIENEAEAKLRQSEIIADAYLSNLGYKLKRCIGIGYPDFRVANKNVWFEIKTPGTGLNRNQLRQFDILLNKKHIIYIVYVSNNAIKIFDLKLSSI